MGSLGVEQCAQDMATSQYPLQEDLFGLSTPVPCVPMGMYFQLSFIPKEFSMPLPGATKAQPVEVTGESLQKQDHNPTSEAPWEHLQAPLDSKSSQNGAPWGLMLGEQALGSPPFPFMAKVSLWSEDKSGEALGQAVVPPESIPSFLTGPAKPFLPQFQGNQD